MWNVLKQEFKKQFMLSNTTWVACDALGKLKQIGLARDYVKQFSSPMLDVMDMLETNKLYMFLRGLQPWAPLKLGQQGV